MSSTESADPGPRRRLPAAERRELIERAALTLFAERGYHRTAIDEIARRAGVSPPVLYDHFPSKVALHRRLLERTRDELLAMWRANLGGEGPPEAQVARAFAAWARYVRAHPYAARMFFRESTGLEEARAVHEEVSAEADRALAGIVAGLLGAPAAGEDPPVAAMTSEIVRGGLTELAVWWAEHPDVPDEVIVATAMDTLWVGFERLHRGERWSHGS